MINVDEFLKIMENLINEIEDLEKSQKFLLLII